MPLPRRLLSQAWIVTLLLALGYLVWINQRRIERLEQLGAVSGIAPALDPQSPTGYAHGVRTLIAPGHNNESYQWIMQTQQMLATHEWRLRHVSYDNAPIGRAVISPSLYRWWLGAVASADHALTGRSLGLAVEHAAYWADPLLLMILVTGGTLLAAARFGPLTATLWPVVMVTLFPLGGAFLPGCPDSVGLNLLLASASVLALLGGILPAGAGETRPRRWFIAAGIFGGLGLWLNVRTTFPLLIGVGLGALAADWFMRRSATTLPWRAWGIAGATTTVLAWLAEYAPAHLDLSAWRLSEVHPLYALAWLGGGELLARWSERLRRTKPASNKTNYPWVGLAGLALAALPAVMLLKHQSAFLQANPFAFRLTALGETGEAGNLAKTLVREGASLRLVAFGLPLFLLLPAALTLARRDAAGPQRLALWLLLGPALVALGFACRQPSWWNLLDALLLAMLVVTTAGPANDAPRGNDVVAALILLVGLGVLTPGRAPAAEADNFTKPELVGLAERDFSHWLARRMGPDGATVLAPPDLTSSLMYHGGLRGVGSAYQENEEGFRGSVRLVSALHADEAQALARQRNLTHIVIPSWENFLDEYARLGGTDPNRNLMAMLHQWLPPRWLRPVPYYLPAGANFEDERLVLFEMTEVQDHASSLSRLTEYFLDMNQFELAGLAGRSLAADYGADLGAQITQARIAITQRDRAAFEKSLRVIATAVENGSDDALAWDRRVALSMVLAEARRMPLARAQAQRCLDEMGELDLRGLSEATLYRFLSLCKVLNLQIADENLRTLAKELLPPSYREKV